MDMEQKTMKISIGRNAYWAKDTGEVWLVNGSLYRPERMHLGYCSDLLSAKDLVHYYLNTSLGYGS